MKTSEVGIDLITRYEGFSSTPYKCSAGVWTIGFGSTWDMDNNRITKDNSPMTKESAKELLSHELCRVEKQVNRYITAPLNQNQFDALVSFTYNLGSGNLQSSTLRRKLNRLDYEGAADEFPKWRRAGGVVLKGLVKRRADEQALFLS